MTKGQARHPELVHEHITQKERERRAVSHKVKRITASVVLLSLLLICIAWTMMTEFYGVSANPSQYRHVYLMIVLCFICNVAGLAVLLLGPEVAKSKRFSSVHSAKTRPTPRAWQREFMSVEYTIR